ncbi:hypothetical protein EV182_001005 [Spiromyces aspiralis]|uniref:Uncharacterized protein n=1 Tax=Spiromyces aspiralis TaxID=68401 RepID=A0ACC1HU50_9FUNG|nr:hypothetical protein EV182_001005 [Spiromyces aspiralis]
MDSTVSSSLFRTVSVDEYGEDACGSDLPEHQDAISAAADGVEFYPAECYVERSWTNRREKYYYTMGKKTGTTTDRGGRLPRRYRRGGIGEDAAPPAPATSGGRHKQQQQLSIAFRLARDLATMAFPHGVVTSKGTVSMSEIDATVVFRADGCDGIWHGFMIDHQMFVHVPDFHGNDHDFRNAKLALMELAEDVLMCKSLVVFMPKASPATLNLVRAFLYTGFEMVPPQTYKHDPSYMLVGYDVL